jgi:hypothetical protein
MQVATASHPTFVHAMKNSLLRSCFAAGVSIALGAALIQPCAQTFKIIGATFIEAPPNREKNLSPFHVGQTQEKAEVHAILSVTSGRLIDIPGFSREQSLTATAMYADKSTALLGPVEISPMARVSSDGKSMLVSMSVSRLSDKRVSAVNFAGMLKVRSARSTSVKSAKFTAKPGALIDLGLGETKVKTLDGATLTIEGSAALERISAIKFVGADGKSSVGELASSGRVNERYDRSYRFTPPILDGRLEVTLFDGMETNDIPVQLTIARPY